MSELPAGNGMLEVRPNPVDDRVVFSYTLPAAREGALLTLTDAQGRRIKTFTLQDKEGQKLIDVRNLNAGIYFYTLTAGTHSRSGKLMVNH